MAKSQCPGTPRKKKKTTRLPLNRGFPGSELGENRIALKKSLPGNTSKQLSSPREGINAGPICGWLAYVGSRPPSSAWEPPALPSILCAASLRPGPWALMLQGPAVVSFCSLRRLFPADRQRQVGIEKRSRARSRGGRTPSQLLGGSSRQRTLLNSKFRRLSGAGPGLRKAGGDTSTFFDPWTLPFLCQARGFPRMREASGVERPDFQPLPTRNNEALRRRNRNHIVAIRDLRMPAPFGGLTDGPLPSSLLAELFWFLANSRRNDDRRLQGSQRRVRLPGPLECPPGPCKEAGLQ